MNDFRLDWEHLRSEVLKHGVRNSLLLAPMPTASTSQILGNNECIEPVTSNIYSRNTLAGSFVVVQEQRLGGHSQRCREPKSAADDFCWRSYPFHRIAAWLYVRCWHKNEVCVQKSYFELEIQQHCRRIV